MEQTVQSTKQWTEPKALRKARKRREKAEKLAAAEPKKETVVASNKRYVCCLKHGTKYTADYVNGFNHDRTCYVGLG